MEISRNIDYLWLLIIKEVTDFYFKMTQWLCDDGRVPSSQTFVSRWTFCFVIGNKRHRRKSLCDILKRETLSLLKHFRLACFHLPAMCSAGLSLLHPSLLFVVFWCTDRVTRLLTIWEVLQGYNKQTLP